VRASAPETRRLIRVTRRDTIDSLLPAAERASGRRLRARSLWNEGSAVTTPRPASAREFSSSFGNGSQAGQTRRSARG
jgi:hypothetical protein